MTTTPDPRVPFPALTTAQRWHLEVYGYAVVENVLDPDLTGEILESLQALKSEFMACDDPWNAVVRNCSILGRIMLASTSIFTI